MKFMKKIMPMMLAVMLFIAALPLNAEAATQKVYAGDTVTVSIPVTEGFGGEGSLVISDEDLFSAINVAGNNIGSFQKYNEKIAFSSSEEITNGSIDVTVTISESAKAGDKCTISVAGYEYVDFDDCMVASALSSQTVVVAEVDASADSDDEDAEDESGWKPSDTVLDTTDYTALREQIAIAESLESNKYTSESWEALVNALQDAYNADGCRDQVQVDAATQALKDAIAALVEVDYTKLDAAVQSADDFINSDELGKLWAELAELLKEAEELLAGNDQAAIDEKAAEIEALIEKIKGVLAEDSTATEPDQPGNAEPEGEYCNIPIHKVWPILFFVSLLLNIILIVLLMKKKKEDDKEVDDTPMVDYEIGEDDK